MAHASSNLLRVPLSTSQNLLLSALRPEDRELLAPHWERVPILSRDVMFRAGEKIEFCHFVLTGVISMVAEMADGDMTEVGVVGCEGFTGSSAVLGNLVAEHQAITQVSGEALRINARLLQTFCVEHREMRSALLRFLSAQMGMLAQAAACNVLHTAEQRFSRWLLMIEDRMGNSAISITHEFLATMIGSRRATVTVTADSLQKNGIIAVKRGQVLILDRARLEQRACECYAKMRDALARAHVLTGVVSTN